MSDYDRWKTRSDLDDWAALNHPEPEEEVDEPDEEMKELGAAGQGTAGRGRARLGVAWRGLAQPGEAGLGKAWRGSARHGAARSVCD